MKFQFLLIIFSYVLSTGSLLATEKVPEIAIIIDDLGTNWSQAKKILQLPKEVTTSILPFTPYARKIALRAATQGRSIMMHVPMEANKRNDLLGPGALRSSMAGWQLLTQLRKDIVSLPNVVGINNHMGSRLTQESVAMRWVMALLRWQGLYFIDSRTTADTVAEGIADSWGVASSSRDVFLDHDISEAAIEEQFERLLAVARQQGTAIAIGHPHPETIKILKKRLPELAAQGFRLVTPETIINARSLKLALHDENEKYSSGVFSSKLWKLQKFFSWMF